MSIRTQWFVLPVALLFTGTVASAQNQATSTNLNSRVAPIFEETRVERTAASSQPALTPTTEITETMNGLSNAFAAKDLHAIKELWPTIPQKPQAALQKSFGYFESVSRNFRLESIDVQGDFAAVAGSYSGSLVRGKNTIPSIGRFRATLRRTGSHWIVDSLICN